MDEIVAWLAGWYNWPFLLTLLIGVLFILADLFLGGVSDLIGLDADADVDVDGPDLDMDLGADVDIDADFDGPDPDVGAAKAGSFLLNGLAWVGLGKVPVSVLLEVMLITFGCTGLLVNAVVADIWAPLAPFAFPISLVAAGMAAPVVTKAIGGFIASIIPADATTTRKPSDFQSEVGTAATLISKSTGQVRLDATDTHPSTILNARCHESVGGDIPRGEEVVLVGYDADTNTYIAVPTNLEL